MGWDDAAPGVYRHQRINRPNSICASAAGDPVIYLEHQAIAWSCMNAGIHRPGDLPLLRKVTGFAAPEQFVTMSHGWNAFLYYRAFGEPVELLVNQQQR